MVAPPLPFRFTAYDGSSAGPADAPLGMHVATPRALTYVLTAPGDLGMARAYVAGDLTVRRRHPGRPVPDAARDGRRHAPHPPRPPASSRDAAARSRLADVLRPVRATRRRRRHRAGGGRWTACGPSAHSKERDAESISKHYDISNAFYEHVLGPSMAYTCAVYATPTTSLDDAQDGKFGLVFDKLGLQPGQRLLDVGCGWGSMVRYAARRGVRALGVTLSAEQAAWAQQAIRDEGLQDLAEVRFLDYRDVADTDFDAVSSIGLTEHIGVANYPGVLPVAAAIGCGPGGRLLNHCITRPENTSTFRTEAFIDRYVFPDGELTGSGRIITEMQDVGFEVRRQREPARALRVSRCATGAPTWSANWAPASPRWARAPPGRGACTWRPRRLGFETQRDPAAPGARGPPAPGRVGGGAAAPLVVTPGPARADPPAGDRRGRALCQSGRRHDREQPHGVRRSAAAGPDDHIVRSDRRGARRGGLAGRGPPSTCSTAGRPFRSWPATARRSPGPWTTPSCAPSRSGWTTCASWPTGGAAILESLAEQGVLTDALAAAIAAADTKSRLEDIYLPFKPKRRTRAQIAREAGLDAVGRRCCWPTRNATRPSQAAAFVAPEPRDRRRRRGAHRRPLHPDRDVRRGRRSRR